MSASQHPGNRSATKGYVTGTHAALFVTDPVSCDACGADLSEPEPDTGFGMRGSGLYMWTRGDELRCEEPPLCADCAAAIGLSALARWEIEEEEG